MAKDGIEVTLRSLSTIVLEDRTFVTISYKLSNTTKDLRYDPGWAIRDASGEVVSRQERFLDRIRPGLFIVRWHTFEVRMPSLPSTVAYPGEPFSDTVWDNGDFTWHIGESCLSRSPRPQSLAITPAEISYDGQFHVTVKGLPPAFILNASSVTLAGVRVDLPGYFGRPGGRPKSDDKGTLTFTSRVPDGVSLGAQSLRVHIAHVFCAEAPVNFPGASISVSPTAGVANERLIVSGSGFSVDPNKHESRLTGSHQISGREPSLITLNGKVLTHPHVDYPIDLDSHGNFFTPITLPITKEITRGGSHELVITDTGGRSGKTSFNTPTPSLIFDPPTGYPLETVKVYGSGFPASNSDLGLHNMLTLTYEVVENEALPSQYYFPRANVEASADRNGNFITNFEIPVQAKIPSTNRVSVRSHYGEDVYVLHKVPIPSIAFEPRSGFPGQRVVVTLKGINRNYTLSAGNMTLGGVALPIPGYFGIPGSPPKTDRTGSVSFVTTIPKNVPTGVQDIGMNLPGGAWLKSPMTVLTSSLKISPESAVPGQRVVVTALDLSPGFVDSFGTVKRHQITGDRSSYMTINGERVGKPLVDYPIGLDSEGGLFFSFDVPIDDSTISGVPLDIRIIDTGGRLAIGRLNIKTPMVSTVSPVKSIRGSMVKVTGEGFIGSDANARLRYPIDVRYAGRRVATSWADASGTFSVSFRVPRQAFNKSTNLVSAKIRKYGTGAGAYHEVPDVNLELSSTCAYPGGDMTVVGTGFEGFRKVWISVGGIWVSFSDVHTDVYGNFEATVRIPRNVPVGAQSVMAMLPGKSKIKHITVQRSETGCGS